MESVITSQPGKTGKAQANPCCQERADDHLAFPTDIDHIATKGDANTNRNQQQRRCLDESLCKGIGAAECPIPKSLIRFNGIDLQEEQT